jgi:hypothetical protein
MAEDDVTSQGYHFAHAFSTIMHTYSVISLYHRFFSFFFKYIFILFFVLHVIQVRDLTTCFLPRRARYQEKISEVHYYLRTWSHELHALDHMLD